MRIEEAFAQVLREQRRSAGLSQHDLAYEANINRNNISLYETGERLPSFATFFAICRALKIPPETLVKRVTDLKPSTE
ncbi:MAG: transcriptional regulator [Puniceicoccaceae bacterium]|nr:transcriptional regulator [Puniceicoccaceae bacterium]